MWHVWNNVRRFAKHLGAQRRIPRLTVNFTDTRETTWATERIADPMIDLDTPKKSFYGYAYIDQILITLCMFIINVDKPRLVISPSCLAMDVKGETGQDRIEIVEDLMTSRWYMLDYGVENAYRIVEDDMKEMYWSMPLRGLCSIPDGSTDEEFEKKHWRKIQLSRKDHDILKLDWPCRDNLPDWEPVLVSPRHHCFMVVI